MLKKFSPLPDASYGFSFSVCGFKLNCWEERRKFIGRTVGTRFTPASPGNYSPCCDVPLKEIPLITRPSKKTRVSGSLKMEENKHMLQ
jgi:hypothetical protein